MPQPVAIYPGSFDPMTNGHLDIINRSLQIFDELTVLVAHNHRKQYLFSVEERKALVEASVNHDPRIKVDVWEGLIVDYAKKCGATVILRGLRAVADFEFEFQMANMNRHLSPGCETLFLMTGADNFYVSSSLVREVARLDGDIDELVPAPVAAALRHAFSTEN